MAVLALVKIFLRCGNLLLPLLLTFQLFAQRESQIPAEYKLKAAFLYNFAQFVEWPDDQRSHFTIAIVGPNPFGSYLEAGLAKDTIKGRPIRVVHVQRASEITNANMVFLPRALEKIVYEELQKARNPGVLTVSDLTGFASMGGIIELYMDNGKVRYAVNLAESRNANLVISSKLLRLGRVLE